MASELWITWEKMEKLAQVFCCFISSEVIIITFSKQAIKVISNRSENRAWQRPHAKDAALDEVFRHEISKYSLIKLPLAVRSALRSIFSTLQRKLW